MAETGQDEADQPDSKKKKIIKLILHILFHILFIGYTIWATVVYIQYNREGETCDAPPENETSTNSTEAPANPGAPPGEPESRAENNTETTTFKPNVLCEMNFCIGYGLLLIMFFIFYTFWLYYFVFKPFFLRRLYNEKFNSAMEKWVDFSHKRIVSIIMVIVLLVLVTIYLLFECWNDFMKLVGLCGPVAFILLGYAMSYSRSDIPWRVVVHGLLGQLLLGILCIRLSLGRTIFHCAGEKAARFLGFAQYGARFVYGDRICDEFVFAFAILAVIFFFSVVTNILYFLGAMQWFLQVFGFVLQALVGTTVCESVNAIGNIFLGMSESPMMIRPYIPILTKSELHTICTSGYSTVSGTTLGAYISFGASPAHLITASVMAAPGSLAFSKLYYPETEESQTKAENIKLEKSTDKSILEAAITGAANGLLIVLGIVSNIIAFLAIVYFLNAVVEWLFELVGLEGITFLWLLTKFFIPLAFVMGVPTYDCERVAKVVAEKTVINEFVGYKTLGSMIQNDELDFRSAGIATFALCGFANPGSLGILIAALSAMAPMRRYDITQVALRAFITGSVVSFTSACFAG
ncbi:hypothetical protein KR222_007883, partial [Zaprionus bogoriensis]